MSGHVKSVEVKEFDMEGCMDEWKALGGRERMCVRRRFVGL